MRPPLSAACLAMLWSLGAGPGGPACAQPPGPAVERTTGKEQEWFERHLREHAVSVACSSDSARIESDGRLGVFDSSGEWAKAFSVRRGGAFRGSPDHHAFHSFDVLAVTVKSVRLRYTSRFDHRSFGPNLITEDSGEVELACRPGPGQAGAEAPAKAKTGRDATAPRAKPSRGKAPAKGPKAPSRANRP